MPGQSSSVKLSFLLLVSILLLLAGCGTLSPASTLTPGTAATRAAPAIRVSFREFSLPGASLAGITRGPDGALWFTNVWHIERISLQGTVTQFALTRTTGAFYIVAGPDGALWFTDPLLSKIGRITTSGKVDEFALPDSAIIFPYDITVGSDGALWFTEETGEGGIGRITTKGRVTEFHSPNGGSTLGIAAGPDGALWFTESPNTIGRIATSGIITVYALPTPNTQLEGIAAGPDGALWFTETNYKEIGNHNEVAGSKIGRITTSGVITEYALPTPDSRPEWITAGPDGALWFTEGNANKIGRITIMGTITEYGVPTGASVPDDITAGPDGTLWFTEENRSKIGEITITY